MTDLWSLLTTDPYLPFTIAFFLMVGIGIIEVIGLGLGEFPDAHIDLDFDGHTEGLSLLGWLGFGSGMPILIWLTSLLATFTLVGFIMQQLLTAILNEPLTMGWAIIAAIPIALFFNRFIASGIARIIPKEETSALDLEDLLCCRGIVLNAPAKHNSPSRVKVVDRFGQAHYLPIVPHDKEETLFVGDTVLLVRKEGNMFFGQAETPSSFRPI